MNRFAHGPDEPSDPRAPGDGANEVVGADLTPEAAETSPPDRPPRPAGRGWWKLVVVGLAAVLVLALVLAYRHHQERRIVALSVARAQQLIRSDTWLGYHEASALLGVRAATIDPLEAGALRAFALAMLSLDSRDKTAVAEANAALVERPSDIASCAARGLGARAR